MLSDKKILPPVFCYSLPEVLCEADVLVRLTLTGGSLAVELLQLLQAGLQRRAEPPAVRLLAGEETADTEDDRVGVGVVGDTVAVRHHRAISHERAWQRDRDLKERKGEIFRKAF